MVIPTGVKVKVRGEINLMRAQANGYFRRELRAASRFDFVSRSANSSSLRSSKFCGGKIQVRASGEVAPFATPKASQLG